MNSDILSGIRVLDLSLFLPGPYCTVILADFGAEVIKVEPPRGEGLRWYPPFLENDESAYFFAFNRNKKSLTLDLRSSRGKEIFLELCQEADVIVEGFRPGVTRQMGIDYESVSQLNEQLIYCSITGYGQDSPMGDEPGHDINFQAVAGTLDICGIERPVLPGIPIGDVGGGTFPALSSILLALIARGKTGKGQYIDISMADSLFFYLPIVMANSWGMDQPAGRGEFNLSGSYGNYAVYETKDHKFVSLGALEQKFWRRFTEKIGQPEWGEKYADVVLDKDFSKKIAVIIATKTREEWVKIFEGSKCCFTPVNSMKEAEKYMESRMLTHLDGQKIIGNPLKLSLNPPDVTRNPAPSLGQNTNEILVELLDYSEEQLDELRDDNVI